MTDEEIMEIMKRECSTQWGLDLVANVMPFARAIISAEREACARVAENHECGGVDDFVCRGQNCGSCIAGMIRLHSKGRD